MAATDQDRTKRGAQTEMTGDEAQRLATRYRRPEGGPAGCVQVYDDTARVYDQFLKVLGYNAPKYCAQTMDELYPDRSQREKVRILDVAAGTGQVGEELHNLGFRQLEALDPSQGMLDVAATKGVYSRLIKEFLTDKQLPMEDNTYDCLVTSGSMVSDDYIPVAALHEMIRLVRPGGFIVIIMRTEYYLKDFGRRMSTLMGEVQDKGGWRQVMHRTFPDYYDDLKEGRVIVHQVL